MHARVPQAEGFQQDLSFLGLQIMAQPRQVANQKDVDGCQVQGGIYPQDIMLQEAIFEPHFTKL